jgi:hypothetical protein
LEPFRIIGMCDAGGPCVPPLIKSDAEIIKTRPVGIKTLAACAENSYELWYEVQNLPELRFLLVKPLFGDSTLFDIEVDPNPTYECSIVVS